MDGFMGGLMIVGGGGHAKSVIGAMVASGLLGDKILDDSQERWGTEVLGIPVDGPISTLKELDGVRAVVAIGDNRTRQAIANDWDGQWENVIHPSAYVDESCVVGKGVFIGAGAVIQPDAHIRDFAIINTGATVDHDCVIGPFAHVGPGTNLAGNVVVGVGAFLGIGCSVIPGVKIGDWARLGAGAVAIVDIPNGATAVGCPARVLLNKCK